MNRTLILLIFCLSGLGFTQCDQQDNDSGPSEKNPKNWAWMTIEPNMSERQWIKKFERMHDSGIDAVIMLLRNRDIEPYKEVVTLAKDVGMQIHVWIPTTKSYGIHDVESEHPEWYMVSRNGESSLDKPPYIPSYKWLCPNHSHAREFIVDFMQKVAQQDFVDGVHLDYIRFPDVILPIGIQPKYDLVQDKEYPEFDFCYCDSCRHKYEQQYGIDPMDFEDPASDSTWVQFRYNTITGLVNTIAEVVHAEGKFLTAAVFPTPDLAKQLVRQEWVNWNLDAIMPMIYHQYYLEPLSWVEEATRQGVEALSEKVEYFSGVFVPEISAKEMPDMVKYSLDGGAEGICLFNANYMSKKQWKSLKSALID